MLHAPQVVLRVTVFHPLFFSEEKREYVSLKASPFPFLKESEIPCVLESRGGGSYRQWLGPQAPGAHEEEEGVRGERGSSAESGGGERGRRQSLEESRGPQSLEEESGGPPQSLEWRLGVSAVGRAAL